MERHVILFRKVNHFVCTQVHLIESYWWIFFIGSLPLYLPLCPVSLLVVSCSVLLKPTNAVFVPTTNFLIEPLWQWVLSHTSFLCLTCSAGMTSLSCFCSRQMFLWTAATTITHNSLYSFMLLLHFFGLLLKWEGKAATHFCHFGNLLLQHKQLQEDIPLIGNS